MSASLGEAVLDLTADNVKLKDSLGNARDVVSKALGGIGAVARGALTVGLGVAAGAVAGLGAALGVAVGEAMEAQTGLAQLDAVLKSTGGKSGMTRDALLDLADSIQQLTPVSDDAVVAGESMLLTFTNIGKDVFPQTTKTLLDMATAMNSGAAPSAEQLKSQAIQLGKALNDPVAGLTALTRVGVTFTDAQKAQIEALVKAGDTMGAQKLILKELQTEFGGSAEAAGKTFAGQLQILKNRILNVAEGIGTKLLPYAQNFMTNVVMPLVPRLEKLGEALGVLISGGARGDVFRAIREALTGLVPDNVILNIFKLVDVFTRVSGIVRDLLAGRVFQAIRAALTGIVPDYVIMQILSFIRTLQTGLATNLPIALQTLANFWTTTLQPAIMQVINLIVTNWPTVQNILIGIGAGLAAIGGMGIVAGIVTAVGAAIAALASPVGMIAIAVGVLTAAWLNNWGGIRDTLTAFWVNTAQPILSQLWDILANGAAVAIPQMVAFVQGVLLPALLQFWSWVQANVFPLLGELWNWLAANLPGAIQTLVTFFTGTLLPAIISVETWVISNLIPLLSQLWAWLQVNVPLALQTLSNFWTFTLMPAITAVWMWITTSLFPLLQTLWNWLSVNIPIALQVLSDVWTNVLWPAITAVWAWMNDVLFPFFQALAEFWSAVFNKVVEAAAGLWQKVLLPAFTAVWDFLVKSVLPILQAIGDYLVKTFSPTFKTLSDFFNNVFLGVLKAIHGAFQGISDIISSVTGHINSLAESIRNIKLPDWLTPGSPTPFEMGLRGIADALADVNARLPELSANLNVNGGGAGPGGMSSPVTNDNRTTFNLTARYQNQTLTSLGDTVRLLALARA